MTSTQPPIVIASPELTATVSQMGAELQSLTDASGRDFLWHGDPAWWPGRAPLLFPIVGALAGDSHEVDGRRYTLPRHGFARRSRFGLVASSPSEAVLRLSADDTSRAAFPWEFQLDIGFRLDGPTLQMAATVTNLDGSTMPCAFGYHPAFLWPLPGAGPRDAQVLTFASEETVPASRIDKAGLLVGEEPLNRVANRRLRLSDDLFDDDALLFLSPASRSLRYGAADGRGPSLEIGFSDLPHLGIWTKPGGAPFLCIEPWHGYASPADFTGPLADKPGMVLLEPGQSRRFPMHVTLIGG